MAFTQTHRDYEGQKHYPSWTVDRAKGLGYSPITDQRETSSSGFKPETPRLYQRNLIIPCSRAVTTRIKDFLETQHLMAGFERNRTRTTFGPYYFTVTMAKDYSFEGKSDTIPLIGGPDTAYAKKLEPSFLRRLFSRIIRDDSDDNDLSELHMGYDNPQMINYARYNCWTASQGITQYIGGVDLGRIAPGFATVYRAAKAVRQFENLAETLQARSHYLYETLHQRNDMVIARREDGPPFILFTGTARLKDLLERPIGRDSIKLEDWLETQKLFEPEPLSQHIHNRPRQGLLNLVAR